MQGSQTSVLRTICGLCYSPNSKSTAICNWKIRIFAAFSCGLDYSLNLWPAKHFCCSRPLFHQNGNSSSSLNASEYDKDIRGPDKLSLTMKKPTKTKLNHVFSDSNRTWCHLWRHPQGLDVSGMFGLQQSSHLKQVLLYSLLLESFIMSNQYLCSYTEILLSLFQHIWQTFFIA